MECEYRKDMSKFRKAIFLLNKKLQNATFHGLQTSADGLLFSHSIFKGKFYISSWILDLKVKTPI